MSGSVQHEAVTPHTVLMLPRRGRAARPRLSHYRDHSLMHRFDLTTAKALVPLTLVNVLGLA